MDNDALSIWTVYDHPTDYPQYFVARRFEVTGKGSVPTQEIILSEDLGAIRYAMVVRGLGMMLRDPGDDPKIIETWI